MSLRCHRQVFFLIFSMGKATVGLLKSCNPQSVIYVSTRHGTKFMHLSIFSNIELQLLELKHILLITELLLIRISLQNLHENLALWKESLILSKIRHSNCYICNEKSLILTKMKQVGISTLLLQEIFL